jgi:lysophospholipase L1-like esterase
VLVSFGVNDAARVAMSDAEFAQRPITQLRVDRFLHRVRVGQLVLASLDRVTSSPRRDGLVPRVSVEEYSANLTEMVTLAKRHRISIVFLTRAYTGVSNWALWWKNFAPAYRLATLEVGDRHGVPVLNVYDYFRDAARYFIDESHFTPEGYQRMADFVYEHVQPFLHGLSPRVAKGEGLRGIEAGADGGRMRVVQ